METNSGYSRLIFNDLGSSFASEIIFKENGSNIGRIVNTQSRLHFTDGTGATKHFTFEPDTGNIGIGVIDPEHKLHIVNDGAEGFYLANSWVNISMETNGGYSRLIFNDYGSGYANEIIFQESGTDAARIVNTQSKLHFTNASGATKHFTFDPANGRIGISEENPDYLLDMGSGGAYCDGSAWTNGSSRKYKDHIRLLQADEALDAFKELEPVKFSYKINPDEECIGFIAEDVPELLATKNRDGANPMDYIAILVKVVQEQNKTIDTLTERIEELERKDGYDAAIDF
jgi:hypothetical protein